jgi:single-stranded-DNA-specific exonuclease
MGRAAGEYRHLDLVALGIVADVAPLTPTNRALLTRGLGQIWREPRPGIRALLDLSGPPAWELDTEPISFRLAPALNSAGRLADARVGVELLLTEDLDRARTLATELWALNTERKKLAAELDGDVRACLANQASDAPAMVLAGIGWHPGLIGVAASHLLHELGRTVVVISRDPAGGSARGSARSADGVGVLEILAELTDLLGHWGGHSHAAGFNLPDQGIDYFRERFVEAVGRRGLVLGPSLNVDAVVPWRDVVTRGVGEGSLYQILTRLAPYSEGNRPPILASLGLRVVGRRSVGAGDRHTKLVLADDRQVCQEVLWWNSDPTWQPEGLVDAAFTLSSNEWQGSARLRLTLEGIRPHAGRQEEHESSA